MEDRDEKWEDERNESNEVNKELEDLKRLSNILSYLVKRKSSTVNLKQAITSVLANQIQVELAFQSAKYDVIYSNAKGNNALKMDSNTFNSLETTFKKLRNINVIIELCRACGMFQYEEQFLNALLEKEFDIEKKQNSLISDIEKMMVKTLNEYVLKLNKLEITSKREKDG